MARYAIGDIQGCYSALQCVLELVAFDPEKDELWLTGDLVNRGPDSLATLRYLYSIRHACKIVLGNHDLHLLAVASGVRNINSKDTFDDVLSAHDAPVLLAWLQSLPLAQHDKKNKFIMTHAGVPPIWSVEETMQYAAEVERVLQSGKAKQFFKAMYGEECGPWDAALRKEPRWRAITDYLTRMRFCTRDGELDLLDKSSTKTQRKGFKPWFEFKAKKRKGYTVLFGHWAALEGKTGEDSVLALDTGCVWGGSLTAVELETLNTVACKCAAN